MKNSTQFQARHLHKLLKRFCRHFAGRASILSALFLLACATVFAQGKQVTGSVTDDSGVAIPNVSVRIKGTTSGTFTGGDGKFKLNVPNDSAVLVISTIGYETQELTVGSQTDIKISLKTSVSQLSDIVVVGYGSVQKRNLTSAVTTVNSKDFLQGGYNSPLQMIDGKVAGVTVSNPAAADPNRGTDIQIRGAASLEAGNGPLVVIDGMPGGDLRNIAQQDIESITVLKDASAAAIYGSRGANGVVLVQTKRGKSGDVSVTYDSYVEHDVVAAKPELLSAEEFLEKGRDTDRGARTNWYNELLRTNNFGTNQFLTVSGGTPNSIFRLSGNYRSKTGIDIATERKEYGYRANFQQKALDGVLEFTGNLSQRIAKEEYTNYNAFQQAVKLNPTLPVMDPDNPLNYNTLQGYDTYNPVQDLLARENGADQNYSIVDLNVKLNILKNLSTEVKVARQGHEMLRREYYTSKSAESVQNDRLGRARLQSEKWTDYTLEWLGNYNTRIDKHDIALMGGYSYQEFNNQAFWAENMDFISDGFGYNNLDDGSWNLEEGRLGMDSYKSKEKLIAFLGRLNYNFDNTYFLTASFRYEGNSKFGANNKWGMFPAVSAAWRISNLEALRGSSVINDLKIRASYGVTGRSGFPRYTSLAKYAPYGRYLNDEGEWVRVYGPGNNFNPNVQWERAVAYNIGLDFALLDNRLTGSLDVFDRRSRDILGNYDVPVGAYLHEQMFVNVGTTSSKGVELTANWKVAATKDFTYNTNVTASYIKTKLVTWSNNEFHGNFRYLQNLPSPGNPGPAYRLDPGTELGSFYGYKYAGVDEEGRILIWKDGVVGKEKIIASSEGNADRDRAYIGHGAPRYELAWGNNFTYKNLDLSLFFRGRFDYDILNLYQMYYGLQAEPGINLLADAYSRNGHIKSGKVITDYFLEKGDYFKLDNLTLGWSPNLGVQAIRNFRIYGSVRNVFTITKYTGLDPTVVNVTGLTPGYGDLGVYPITRTFTFGAQVTF
ncbi:SusC/RagA family TonB-linked outer membrane protein [Chitinophaga cymbidii]|uniref:SusC/RagA family TonB-linked outer membrane protein n=1 Tax=Chitinophaga cymbidii TaxID=1096750 RepID=UPI0011BD7A94|nr:SusC/RagA family TonB-linked outer membrane protein [Chitinophaga cymbidii]